MKNITLIVFLSLSVNLLYSQKTWQEVTIIADSLSFENQFKKAMIFREKAINLAKNESKKTKKMLSIFKDFSNSELYFIDKKTYEKGYKELKNHISKLENLNIDKDLLYPRYKKLYIYAYDYLFNFKDTEHYTTLSLNFLNSAKVKDTLKLFEALQYSAISKRELGKLANSISHIKMAIKLLSNFSKIDSNFIANCYINYADIYRKKFLNLPLKNYQLLKKAEGIYTKIKNPNLTYFSGVYIRLGDLEKQIGNYENAEGYLNKNYKIFNLDKNTSVKNKDSQISLAKQLQYYHYLVGIYSAGNNEKKMIDALNKMEKINNENKLGVMEKAFLSIAYQSTGNYYTKKNQKKALVYYDEGLIYNPKFPTFDFEPDFFIEIARTYIKSKNYKKAIIKLKDAVNNPTIIYQVEIDAYKLLAISYLNIDDSENLFKHINLLINKISSNKNEKINIRDFKLKQYKPSNSLSDANHFVDLAEELSLKDNKFSKEIFNLYNIALVHFENNFQKDFVNPKLNKLYKRITNGIYGVIFNENNNYELVNMYLSSFENIESKLLLNSFIQNRTISGKADLNNTIFKEQEIRANITYLKKKIIKNATEVTKQLLFEEKEKLKTLLENTTNEYKSPIFNLEVFLTTNKKTILKYKKIENDLFVVAFMDNQYKTTKINNFSEIKKKIELFNTYLINPNSSITNLKNTGSELYNLLIPKDFKFNKNLTIIPDDILYYLPFELLQFKDDYLLKNTNVNYVSSLSFLNTNLEKDLKNVGKIALFSPKYKFKNIQTELAVRGDYYNLKGAEEEVQAISNVFKNSDVFVGKNATKESFINLKNDYAILHLAMHSILNDKDPELSTLLFSDNKELHISELYGLNLNANLAVLSACNTGVGELKDGKGIVSMSNAFTYAGVPSTVSSLWSAPDQSTKEIMVGFYKNLKQKQSISQSLRNAKLNYLKNTKDAQLKHPYYWAGFVLYGNDTVILLNNDVNYLKWLGLIGPVILVLFFIKKRKTTLNA